MLSIRGYLQKAWNTQKSSHGINALRKQSTYTRRSQKADEVRRLNELSLDIGAGDAPKGDINTGIRPLQGIDVVCDASYLPFKGQVFTHVFFSHVVEHFRYKDVKRLLREARRVLKQGGKLEIWAPNFMAFGVLVKWLNGSFEDGDLPLLYGVITGGQDYDQNIHLSQWNVNLLKTYVETEGFNVIYARGETEYKDRTTWIIDVIKRLIERIFPSRGGVVHLIALKEKA